MNCPILEATASDPTLAARSQINPSGKKHLDKAYAVIDEAIEHSEERRKNLVLPMTFGGAVALLEEHRVKIAEYTNQQKEIKSVRVMGDRMFQATTTQGFLITVKFIGESLDVQPLIEDEFEHDHMLSQQMAHLRIHTPAKINRGRALVAATGRVGGNKSK